MSSSLLNFLTGKKSSNSHRSHTKTKSCKFCQGAVADDCSEVCKRPKCDSLSRKAYSDWTEDDLLYVKDRNVTEWFTIKKERDRLEDERAEMELEQERSKGLRDLEFQRKEHEQLISQQRQDMITTHEARLREMDKDRERKILAMKESVEDSRRQHTKELNELEYEYQERIHNKEKELAKLAAERKKKESEFKIRYGEQHRQLSEKGADIDFQVNEAWEDLNKRMKERSSILEAKLAASQAEFEKKLESNRQVLKKKAEEAFTSRITAQLEIEKSDGSRFKLSETKPGLVTQMSANLGLSPDLENGSSRNYQ